MMFKTDMGSSTKYVLFGGGGGGQPLRDDTLFDRRKNIMFTQNPSKMIRNPLKITELSDKSKVFSYW